MNRDKEHCTDSHNECQVIRFIEDVFQVKLLTYQKLLVIHVFETNECKRINLCSDCKHWIPYDWMFSEVWQSKNIADYPEDEIGCDCCDMAMKANDFCSLAERRTE